MYSGYNTEHNNDDLPEEFVPFYEANYNQVVANWYQDQNDYIAAHSDCQRGMIDNASVCLVSLYETDNPKLYRYLEVTPKNGTHSLCRRFIIRLDHGSIITMHGTTQDEFKHGIKKAQKTVCPRLSLSFRQMK